MALLQKQGGCMTEKTTADSLHEQLSQMKQYFNAHSTGKGVYAAIVSMNSELGHFILEIRAKRNWLGLYTVIAQVFPKIAGEVKENIFDVLLVNESAQDQNFINLLHKMLAHVKSQVVNKYVLDKITWLNHITKFNLSYQAPVDSGYIFTCN